MCNEKLPILVASGLSMFAGSSTQVVQLLNRSQSFQAAVDDPQLHLHASNFKSSAKVMTSAPKENLNLISDSVKEPNSAKAPELSRHSFLSIADFVAHPQEEGTSNIESLWKRCEPKLDRTFRRTVRLTFQNASRKKETLLFFGDRQSPYCYFSVNKEGNIVEVSRFGKRLDGRIWWKVTNHRASSNPNFLKLKNLYFEFANAFHGTVDDKVVNTTRKQTAADSLLQALKEGTEFIDWNGVNLPLEQERMFVVADLATRFGFRAPSDTKDVMRAVNEITRHVDQEQLKLQKQTGVNEYSSSASTEVSSKLPSFTSASNPDEKSKAHIAAPLPSSTSTTFDPSSLTRIAAPLPSSTSTTVHPSSLTRIAAPLRAEIKQSEVPIRRRSMSDEMLLDPKPQEWKIEHAVTLALVIFAGGVAYQFSRAQVTPTPPASTAKTVQTIPRSSTAERN